MIYENREIAEDAFSFLIYYIQFHSGSIGEKDKMKRIVKAILNGVFELNYNPIEYND